MSEPNILQWTAFAISRNGRQWSLRIENGNGMAFELPCRSRSDAEHLSKELEYHALTIGAGAAILWYERT